MDAREIPATRGDEIVRLVRALGTHRYVEGRLHLVHAFVAVGSEPGDELSDAAAWSRRILADPGIDAGSMDERLFRAATDRELVLALLAFWGQGERRAQAVGQLLSRLGAIGAEMPGDLVPFDEEREDDVFPLLIDAGWELLPLSKLDREQHKGAIGAFGEPILFEAACFEEESAIPAPAYLQELPAIGATELVHGIDAEGKLSAPFVVWTSGCETYQDYVLRGVLRAAKI